MADRKTRSIIEKTREGWCVEQASSLVDSRWRDWAMLKDKYSPYAKGWYVIMETLTALRDGKKSSDLNEILHRSLCYSIDKNSDPAR